MIRIRGKKQLMLMGVFALLMGGCTTGGHRETSVMEGSNIQGTETVQNEKKEENAEMNLEKVDDSGELLQNSEEIVNEETSELVVDMEKVTDEVCPSMYSLRRPEVNYGKVEHFTYFSETTNCDRQANILLPADYDASVQYPVLYFLHGIFGDENSMVGDSNNKINEIVNNLKEDGIMGDVLVVFPHMYATGDPNLQPGFSQEQVAPYDNFINDLINDLMPYVEENYGACSDRENRGLIGFSMGGRESLFIGTTRSDLFAYVGAISPAPGVTPGKDWAMEHPGQMKEEEFVIRMEEFPPKMLMLCCGTKDGVVGAFPASYHQILTKNEVNHLWYEIPGADHDSNAIKSGLFNFLIRWAPGK